MLMSLSLAGFQSSPAETASRAVSKEAAFAFIAGAAVFAAVLWMPVALTDPDTLWHIVVGDWILANHHLPVLDTYSFTKTGHPWVAQEWLSEVFLALAYRCAGWNGVLILTAAVVGGTVSLVAGYVRRHARTDIAVMLMVLAITCAEPSLLSRPHILALPLVALWSIGLVSARARGTAPSFALLPVMTLWANLHGGFAIGLVLAGAFAIEAVFDPAGNRRDALRGWGIFIFAAVLAAIITPRGIDTLLFPLQLMSLHNLYRIQEWKPADFSQLNGMSVSILVALYLGMIGTLRLPRFRVLLTVGLVYATMQHVRYEQLFGIIVPILLAGALGRGIDAETPRKQLAWNWAPLGLAGAAAIISLSFRIGLPVERIDAGYYASAALAAVPADLRTKPVLNEYGFGGLLIFDGIRPFVDGRADLYGDDFLDTYQSITHADGATLDDVLCRYGIEWTIFRPDAVVPALMDRTPGWHRLYSDKLAVIHVRDQHPGTLPCPLPPATH
jgi:hypothetical protein